MASNFRLDELIRRYPPREKKQKKAPKVEFQSKQLCWDCANACGGCEWSRSFRPVPGWSASPSRRIQNYGETGFKVIDTYRITACPKFIKEATL